jgi:hypothetical protein
VYLSIGIYIKFFGNIKTFYCSYNPVHEIANSLCDLHYYVWWLHSAHVVRDDVCCYLPLSSCDWKGDVGREQGERVWTLDSFMSFTL